MKTIKIILVLTVLLLTFRSRAQENPVVLENYWQIGLGLGEIPMGGSFKPSITFGYHFNGKVYAGVIYQFKDEISRDASSFNAKSSGLEGLVCSSETVAQRFLLQLRYTPIKNGPYISTGLVFNGKDTETMVFDQRERELNGEIYDGTITIQQTRPAGFGLALGLGYQYNFRNGLSAGFEWTPAWGQYPVPEYEFSGTSGLSQLTEEKLIEKMNEGFRGSVTNMYKVFHLGIAYRFQ